MKKILPFINLALLACLPPRGVLAYNAETVDTEKLLTEVKAELKRISDDVKKTAEQAMAESKKSGDVSAETKKKADELLIAQGKLDAGVKVLEGKLESLESKNRELEQTILTRKKGGDKIITAGAEVISNDDFKAFAAKGARGTVRIAIKNALGPRASITTISGAEGLIQEFRDPEIVNIARRQLNIRDLLNVIPISSNSVEYAKQTVRSGQAAVVAEGSSKPESDYTWVLETAAVRTIAHWVPISRQAMDDAAQLQGLVDSELRYGLDLEEEDEILNGDGTGQHLDGLIENATDFSAAFSPDDVQQIDTLRLMILQVALNDYVADGIVLHPTDWAQIELTKDAQARYLIASAQSATGPRLWGLPVVQSNTLTVNDCLVGAFRVAATIYDRMGAEVLISSEDQDNFIKNMLTVRAEKRLALAVKRPLSLVFNSVLGSS